MNNLQRRNFLKLAATSALIPATGLPAFAFKNKAADKKTVADFRGDGLNHSPAEYANLLARLTETGSIMPDNYSGTLANHLAIRSLSGNNKRVIVQQESHVYNDTGMAHRYSVILILFLSALTKPVLRWKK